MILISTFRSHSYIATKKLRDKEYNNVVNDALTSYPSYQIDFKSIFKSDFRRVCHHVQPEQVIALTLSDSSDTPGQSELFSPRFQMEEFIRLRALK